MKSLRRHIDPWEKTGQREDELFERLRDMSASELGEGWSCWVGSAKNGVSVLVWSAAETTPFRSSGSVDEVLKDYAGWLARRKEQAPPPAPAIGESIKRPDRAKAIGTLAVIRDLDVPCPRCRCALQEVEAQEEGSDERFRYARCPRCEYGEALR